MMPKKLLRLPNVRSLQNFHLVWLDRSIDDNNDDCRNSIATLRQVVNTVNTFTDVDECIDFITDVNNQDTFVIISHELSQIIIPIVQDISQVSSVHIFCEEKLQHDIWIQQWSKVKGVYTDITSIFEALKQAVQHCDQNSVSISFIKTTNETSTQSLDTLDQSFMYTQILKEILLTIDFEESHINDFLTYYRAESTGNTSELKNVDMIEKEYRHHEPIWWYTYPNFLYSMVNRALRFMEVDLIIKMGFFVRDLHQHIVKLHAEQFSEQNNSHVFTVYRGQGLSQTVLDQLKKTQGGLMSFNNFLSTSLDQAVSRAFAESNQYSFDLIGVLFEIKINPSISSSPFANIRDASYYQGEEEILFSMHSVFRIGDVKEIDANTRLWQVDLTLTSDNDPQLYALTQSMQNETRGSTGWHRLGKLMIQLGHYNRAEELYNILLEQINDEDEKADLYHMLGMVKHHQGKYAKAIEYHEKAFKIRQKTLPVNHPNLATSDNNIALVYGDMGEYSKALSYSEKALEIFEKFLPANHSTLATTYNNIGMFYCCIGEYSKALSYYEKALEIFEKTLPVNHPSLATCYNNIGMVYQNMGEYLKALSYYEKALEIEQKTLPVDHPSLATSHNSIGLLYCKMGEYLKALSYCEKALEIFERTLPANHSALATSYNNIGEVQCKMGEYVKALSYYEKALEIFEKILLPNHPSLSASYNNIGMVYYNMGDYSQSLSYHEKTLKIRQRTLPAHHSDLAGSFNNIGMVYQKMDDYPKIVSYYECALDICKRSLPSNHPYLAASYNNIAGAYGDMGEYSKGLSYYLKALEIFEKALPANHPDLAIAYNNIGWVYYSINNYSKALSCYEYALNICKCSLPPNHHLLTTVKDNIEMVKNDYR